MYKRSTTIHYMNVQHKFGISWFTKLQPFDVPCVCKHPKKKMHEAYVDDFVHKTKEYENMISYYNFNVNNLVYITVCCIDEQVIAHSEVLYLVTWFCASWCLNNQLLLVFKWVIFLTALHTESAKCKNDISCPSQLYIFCAPLSLLSTWILVVLIICYFLHKKNCTKLNRSTFLWWSVPQICCLSNWTDRCNS